MDVENNEPKFQFSSSSDSSMAWGIRYLPDGKLDVIIPEAVDATEAGKEFLKGIIKQADFYNENIERTKVNLKFLHRIIQHSLKFSVALNFSFIAILSMSLLFSINISIGCIIVYILSIIITEISLYRSVQQAINFLDSPDSIVYTPDYGTTKNALEKSMAKH